MSPPFDEIPPTYSCLPPFAKGGWGGWVTRARSIKPRTGLDHGNTRKHTEVTEDTNCPTVIVRNTRADWSGVNEQSPQTSYCAWRGRARRAALFVRPAEGQGLADRVVE